MTGKASTIRGGFEIKGRINLGDQKNILILDTLYSKAGMFPYEDLQVIDSERGTPEKR
jgi:hypothetical protein